MCSIYYNAIYKYQFDVHTLTVLLYDLSGEVLICESKIFALTTRQWESLGDALMEFQEKHTKVIVSVAKFEITNVVVGSVQTAKEIVDEIDIDLN